MVSPSNAPGIPRSAVYFDLVCLRSAMTGARTLAPGKSTQRTPRDGGRSADPRHLARHQARRRPEGRGRFGGAGARGRLRGLERVVRAPADRRRARLPRRLGEVRPALGVALGAERDDVGKLADGGQVAERREAREAERVEVVAGEEDEVAVVVAQEAPARVVQEVALADRLDDERDVLAAARGPRARRGERAERGIAARRQPRRGAVQRGGQEAALVADRAGEPAQRILGRDAHAGREANAAAAASTVRSTCSGPWASDG